MQVAQAEAAQAVQPLKQQTVQASRVEYTTWNGMTAHVGYYSNGIIVTIPGMQQYCYQNGAMTGMSNLWNPETINGVEYFKHSYPDGSCVYSSDFQQFVVWG